jgi:hypothetical protein
MSSTPGVWGRLADAMCEIYKFKSVEELIKWVDDFVFFRFPRECSPPYTYTYDTTIIWETAAYLGWPWAPEKHTPFAASFTYIGFLWDLDNKTVCLPDAKRTKYLLRLSPWSTGSLATKLDAEKLTGTLNHCTLVIPSGRAYLSSLYKFIASFTPRSHPRTKHTVPETLANDLSWWRAQLSLPWCGLHIKEPPPPLHNEIHVDASTSWGIGFVMDNLWLAWHLIPGWQSADRDIGWAEMVALELALHSVIAAGYKCVHLIVRSDNQGVVGASHAGKSRNCASNRILRHIVNLFQDHDLWFTVKWISTDHNLADKPSRGIFPPAAKLFRTAPRIPAHLSPFVDPCITARDLAYLKPQ